MQIGEMNLVEQAESVSRGRSLSRTHSVSEASVKNEEGDI